MLYYFCGPPGCLPLVSPRLTHVAAFSWRRDRKGRSRLASLTCPGPWCWLSARALRFSSTWPSLSSRPAQLPHSLVASGPPCERPKAEAWGLGSETPPTSLLPCSISQNDSKGQQLRKQLVRGGEIDSSRGSSKATLQRGTDPGGMINQGPPS